MCIEVINGMADTIAELEEKLAEREWIPCSERLPLVGGTYIVTVEDKDGRHVDAAGSHGDYIDGYWDTFNDWYEGQEVHVIAWKPFPEPYNGYGRETWDYCPYCGSRIRKE